LKFINRENADISFNKVRTDSTFEFNLNNNVVLNWFKYIADSTSVPKNNGILISPTNNTGYFVGFNSTYAYSSIPQTTITVVLDKPNVYSDTLVVFPNRDLHIVESTSATPVSNNKIYLEAGYALRGNIFFDLSSLPKEVAISKALLEFSVDAQSSIDGYPKSDSLFVHMLKDSTNKALTADSLYTTLLTRKDNKFSGDITWMIQRWISGVENQGLNITLYDEYSSVARIVLFGSKEQNALLRPRLTIYYPKKI